MLYKDFKSIFNSFFSPKNSEGLKRSETDKPHKTQLFHHLFIFLEKGKKNREGTMLTTSNPMEEEVKPMVNAIGIFKTAAESREIYSKLRSDREKATFAMMMRMNPEALMNIRKEFFARRDTVDLDEFICITQKHLAQSVSLTVADKREFGMKM